MKYMHIFLRRSGNTLLAQPPSVPVLDLHLGIVCVCVYPCGRTGEASYLAMFPFHFSLTTSLSLSGLADMLIGV